MTIARILFGLLLAGFAAVAPAADKRISLPTGDTITISGWRDSWVVGHAEDPTKWRAMISPVASDPALTGDVGNLRIYVRNMARALENGGLDVDPEQKTIDPSAARGFYVKAHDPNPALHAKSKEDMYADGYTGAMKVGSKPYLFEIAWNKGGEADANVVLGLMKSLRVQ
jgi:hypothetical protein